MNNTPKNPEQGKGELYAELCGGVPDVIFVLAAGVIKGYRGNINRTTIVQSNSYSSLDIHGLIGGGKARSLAAAELAIHFPEATIVTNSNIKREAGNNAHVQRDEISMYGVDESRIITQSQSYNLFSELVELVKLIAGKKLHHVVVVTNEFQIPRSLAMLERIHTLQDPNGYYRDPDFQKALKQYSIQKLRELIHFVSAEQVLPHRDRRYAKVIAKAKLTPEWIERERREGKGVLDLNNGTYWNLDRRPSTFVRQ